MKHYIALTAQKGECTSSLHRLTRVEIGSNFLPKQFRLSFSVDAP